MNLENQACWRIAGLPTVTVTRNELHKEKNNPSIKNQVIKLDSCLLKKILHSVENYIIRMAMNRIFVLLCVVFSLLLAPLAHAAEPDTSGAGYTFADQSSSKKQDNVNLASAEHHCIADRTRIEAADGTRQETSTAFIIIAQTNLAPITIGPLLEPPSRA